MNSQQLIRQVERIMDSHKSKALAWSEQPAAHVRSKINEHFEAAAREIVRLLDKELDRDSG